MASGKLWCGNGIESILVLANDPRKAGKEHKNMAKKPKGHKKGCKCAVCSRMGSHGKKPGHKPGSHALAKYNKPRHPNAPAASKPKGIGAFVLFPGWKETLWAGGSQIGLPLVGKALVMVPVKLVQQGYGNIGLEFTTGAVLAAGLARLSPTGARILAEFNTGRAISRAVNQLTKGKLGLAPLSENRGLHLAIDEAMAALLPSLNALLPSLNGDPEGTAAGDSERTDAGDGVDAGEDMGDGEGVGAGEEMAAQGGSI